MRQVYEGRYAYDFTDAHVLTMNKLRDYVDVSAFKEDDIVEATMNRVHTDTQEVFCITEDKRTIVIPLSEFSIQDASHVREYLGKKICMRITGKCITTDSSGVDVMAYTASRAMLQQEYMDEVLKKVTVRDSILQVCVASIVGNGIFVDCGYGIVSYLSLHTLSVTRIPAYNYTFAKNSIIPVVLVEPIREDNTIVITHRELLGSWDDNVSQITVYEKYVGVVTTVQSYGVFIALTANLIGLAEYSSDVHAGQLVEVYVKSVDKYKQKVKLEIEQVLPYTDLSVISARTKTFIEQYANNVKTNGVWQYGKERDTRRDTLFCFEQREVEFPKIYVTTIDGVQEVENKYFGESKTQVPEVDVPKTQV